MSVSANKSTPTPRNGEAKLPPLNLTETFRDKHIIVIGGTGFLGKVWVSLFLHRFPEVGQVYLLVRPKKGISSEERFWKEIFVSEVFQPLRDKYGEEGFRQFAAEKITPIPGDVSKHNVGIPEDILELLREKAHVVVNVAGVVDFNPPIDEALNVNCFGVQNLISLCKTLGDLPILHTSTCYVAGNKDGTFYEVDPRLHPFPRADEIDIEHWDPEREIEEGLKLIERANHEANEAFRESEFLEKAKEQLRERGESCRGQILKDELEKVRRKYVEEVLREEGLKRAHYWGWTNTYTYTKSIGEQLLLNSGLRVTISRPAIVESSSYYPFTGWNEGINTSAPLIYALLRRGALHMPGSWECVLDLVPNDFVCSGMIASLGALLENRHELVYQYGTADVNPVSTGRIQEIISLYKRRYFRKNPKGSPLFIALQKLYGGSPLTPEQFERYGDPAYSRVAKKLSVWTEKASKFPGLEFLKGTSKQLAGISRTFEKTTSIYNQFLPFMYERHYRFDCSNTRALFDSLVEEDRAKLYWEPEKIDWRQWLMEVHIPGLEKWTMPLIDKKLKKKLKPLRPYPNLIEMMDEVVEDNPYGVCVQKLVDERLETMTFGEFRRGVYAVAKLLKEQGNIQQGDRVLLVGDNSPYWPMAYFGILTLGAVAVPLDPALDIDRLKNLRRSSKAKFALWDEKFFKSVGYLLTSDAEKVAKELEEERKREEDEEKKEKRELKEDADVQETPKDEKNEREKPWESIAEEDLIDYALFEEIAELKGEEKPPVEVEIDSEDLASLIFTSGTTGDPKAVMLTHKNFASLLASLVPLFPLTHEDSSLSILPLHHTFEFACGLLLPFSRGARITYLEELTGENLVTALKEARITALVGVPALWQLLAKRIRSQLKERGKVVATLFDGLFKLNHSIGKTVGFDIGKVLFAPIHRELGGNLRYLISGGAALPKETQELFISLGLPLSEGYGLTEASPVITVSKFTRKPKFGRVGKPIPGVEIKIDSPNEQGVGEVLARGPNVMKGYADNPEATHKVLDEDGWLHTGDLGKLDHKGRLILMGRAKEVIITSSGENVYPDDLEEMIGLPKYIKELAVVGLPMNDNTEQIALLAVPEEDDDLTLAQRIAKARESLHDRLFALPDHSRPKIIHFQAEDLPRTPTKKVKRSAVREILEDLESQFSENQEEAESISLSKTIVDAIIRVTGASREDVFSSNRLAVDLGIDSLLMGELHVELEKALGQKIPSDRLNQCESVREIQQLILDLELEQSSVLQPPKDDEEEDDGEWVELPEFAKDMAKSLLASVQNFFYKRVMKVRVYGRANIPYNRHTIVVANHNSHLDLGLIKTALGSYADGIKTLGAKDYFFEKEEWRRYYFENFTNVIPVDRKGTVEEGLEEARRALQRGETLLIFPEGTRSKTGQLQPFKPGVGVLARDLDVDILPIYTKGSYESMPKGRPLPTKRQLTVWIGPPLSHELLHEKVKGLEPQDAAQTLTRIVQAAIEALRDQETFDLEKYEVDLDDKPEDPKDKLPKIFEYLNDRFDPKRVEDPVTFYFSLGDDSALKWSLIVEKDKCHYHQGKPAGGSADCVLKTSPDIFTRIVTESYIPSPEQFFSGAIKSNNIPLLQEFVRIFDL